MCDYKVGVEGIKEIMRVFFIYCKINFGNKNKIINVMLVLIFYNKRSVLICSNIYVVCIFLGFINVLLGFI